MEESKKKNTEAQIKAHKKYMENFVEVKVRMTPEHREKVKQHAENMGESTTSFINRAIEQAINIDFKIITIKDGNYIVNIEGLYDAFHCLDPKKTKSTMISDNADLSLDCFLHNTQEAFRSESSVIIREKHIRTPGELLNWIINNGTEEFQREMKIRFEKVFTVENS